MNCPACQCSNRDTAKFCDECGHALAPLPESQTAARISGSAIANGQDNKVVNVGGNVRDVIIGDPGPRNAKEKSLRTYLDLTKRRFGSLPSFVRLADKGSDPRQDDRSPPRLAEVFVALEVLVPTGRSKFAFGRGMSNFSEALKLQLPRTVKWSEFQVHSAFERSANGPLQGNQEWLPHFSELRSNVTRTSVLSEIVANKHLLVLGEPGSGKSTLLRHLCWAIAARDEMHLPDWPKNQWPGLPVFVNLRDLARGGPKVPDAATRADADTERVKRVWQCLEQTWKKDELDNMREVLEEFLDAEIERAPILFFDGLDEVAPELRCEVSHCIRAWAERWPEARVVVTCRARSYKPDSLWRLPFPDRTLQAFTLDKQVPEFVSGWFTELKATGWVTKDPAVLAESLLKAINGRPELRPLAPSPLLLTMMCLVHGRDLELPPGKALLYNRLVDLLLWEWESQRENEAGQSDGTGLADLLQKTGGLNRPAATEANIKRAIAELVYRQFQAWAAVGKRRTENDELLLAETDLVDVFMPLHPGCEAEQRKWAHEVVEIIRQRSGLVMEVDDKHQFSFPHKTLAEFLCAFWLCEYQKEKSNAFKNFSASLEHWDDWRETGLLAAGFMARNAKGDQVLPWLHSLVPNKLPTKESKSLSKVIIAAEMLLEIGENACRVDNYGRGIWDNTRRILSRIAEKGWLPPTLRSRAATSLGWFGDPRVGIGLTDDKIPDIRWSSIIDSGSFPIGNNRADGGLSAEQPRQSCIAITEPFVICLHPITFSQYAAFVADGGYANDKWWSCEAGRKWRNSNLISSPKEYDEISQTPNHPQVGVSWFEASAFCEWISAKIGRSIRLPTESHWERAARHTDARTYPWGEGNPKAHANVDGTGIRSSNCVGIFPSGKAECGALDLCGNVWEWTRTPWKENYNFEDYQPIAEGDGVCKYAVRGGSFSNSAFFARCAARFCFAPFERSSHLGFRVMAAS